MYKTGILISDGTVKDVMLIIVIVDGKIWVTNGIFLKRDDLPFRRVELCRVSLLKTQLTASRTMSCGTVKTLCLADR